MRDTIRFELLLAPTSKWGMNSVYSGKHWNSRNQQATQVHLMVRSAIRKQCRNITPFDRPVSVSIWYNSRLDLDNHGYLTKMIIDGMKGLLIVDDDRRYVQELHQHFHAFDHRLIFVEVGEIDGKQNSV